MSGIRPIGTLTLLGAAAPICDGDECVVPVGEAAAPSGDGSSPAAPTAD